MFCAETLFPVWVIFLCFCECDWLCRVYLLISEGPPGTYNKTQNSEGHVIEHVCSFVKVNPCNDVK